MMYTDIGVVAGFLISVVALVWAIKNDEDRAEWNRLHKRYPKKKNPQYKWWLAAYFIIWIIACLYSWYYLEIIELGKFFALAVVLPALGVSGFKIWISE